MNRCLVNNNLTLILSLTENTVLFENSIPLCFRKQKNIVHDPYGLLCGTFMVSLCKFPSLSITFHVLKCVGHSVCRVLQGSLIFVSQNSLICPEVNGFF